MADVKFLSGIATNVSLISSTSGSSNKGTGNTKTSHSFMFRIDSKPVKFYRLINLSEGDEVKVAGFIKMGELHAIVLKNITTGVAYSNMNKWSGAAYILGGVLVSLLCLPFGFIPLMILIGIPMIIIGIVYVKQFNRNEKILERFNVE